MKYPSLPPSHFIDNSKLLKKVTPILINKTRTIFMTILYSKRYR